MAGNVNISTVLKRNLKGGKEFDILMPRVRCKTTHLGEGDTFFTVDRMKDWIEKFRHQTAKLALRLEGRTVEETVNNIYNFLYNHIQYTADGPLQQLRSPACTWMQRKEGVDCKSYSVFASCILSNLGIKHAVRQVRQTYFYPEEFTHVYVVVFKDQSKENYHSTAPTFVIDATKHENTEVNYLEKVDLYMNKLAHVGLNAPQDEKTARIVGNFNRFCQFLLSHGMPVEQVNAIRKGVSQHTSRGKNPRINIVYEGVQVEDTIYPVNLSQPVPFLEIQNAFYGGKGPGLNGPGLGFSFTDAFDSFSGATQSGSGGGDATGGIVDAGLDIASSAIPVFGGIIKAVLGKLELAENISKVLKYGLSSWGASLTPEEMKKRFAEIGYTYMQEKLTSATPDNVDRVLTAIDVQLRGNSQFFKKLRENHAKAKSTQLALDWAIEECDRLLKETIDAFSEQFEANGTQVMRRKVGARSSELNPYPITSFSDKKDIKKDRYWDEIDYFVYEVDKSKIKSWTETRVNTPNPTAMPTAQNNNGEVQTFTPGVQQQSFGGGTASQNESGKKSSNTGLIIGGVVLASLPFLLPMIKGGNPAAKKAPAKKAKK